jgi:hypothetical protein
MSNSGLPKRRSGWKTSSLAGDAELVFSLFLLLSSGGQYWRSSQAVGIISHIPVREDVTD